MNKLLWEARLFHDISNIDVFEVDSFEFSNGLYGVGAWVARCTSKSSQVRLDPFTISFSMQCWQTHRIRRA